MKNDRGNVKFVNNLPDHLSASRGEAFCLSNLEVLNKNQSLLTLETQVLLKLLTSFSVAIISTKPLLRISSSRFLSCLFFQRRVAYWNYPSSTLPKGISAMMSTLSVN